MPPLLPVVLMLVLVQVPPAPVTAVDRAREIKRSLLAIEEAEAGEWAELAETLEKQGDPAGALKARSSVVRPWSAAAPERFPALDETVESPPAADTADPASPAARAITQRTADALLALARSAAAPGVNRFALADRCLRQILIRDPQHAPARQLLGYTKTKQGWATPFAIEQLEAGKIRHPVFGWVPKSWVEHLDHGELPGLKFTGDTPREWLAAPQADALRESLEDHPWVITTPHFRLRTNAPLQEAIAFERRAELFHDLFYSIMADVIGRERLPLAFRFANSKAAARPAARRYEVWYFTSRDEYQDYFQRIFRRDEQISLGYFMPPIEARAYRTTPRSYFFFDPNPAIELESTLFHELSHQLLFESAGASHFERNQGGHYWIWEGLGTYFETAHVDPATSAIQIGEPSGPRMKVALRRLVAQAQRIPLAQFVGLEKSRFEALPEIYLHYNQAMALTLFLMHGQDGRYREGFLEYVRAGYDGKLTRTRGLDQFLGTNYDQLDTEFAAYLEAIDGGPGEPSAPNASRRPR